ncbi:hypothetical protein AB0P32_03655 [Streptomyces sp. NPDC085995]|uniref:hypothetical protein n=1 Tax=Streptomyces sp. NPDC085995 TaxID=3154861 RepID=UPI00344AA7A6
MGLPAYRNTEDGDAQAAEYRVWVRSQHVRPVDGVSYDVVPTERLPPPFVGARDAGAVPPLGVGAEEGRRPRARRVQDGYLTGQELPRGDIAQWAPPVLLPPVAVLFCVMAGWTWWLSMVARTRSPLRERWIIASLVFVAFIPAAASHQLPDVIRRRAVERRAGAGPAGLGDA